MHDRMKKKVAPEVRLRLSRRRLSLEIRFCRHFPSVGAHGQGDQSSIERGLNHLAAFCYTREAA